MGCGAHQQIPHSVAYASYLPVTDGTFDLGSAAFRFRTLYLSTSIILSGASGLIAQGTADAADNSKIVVAGGGAANEAGTRGAQIQFGGNELVGGTGVEGSIRMFTGNVAGARCFIGLNNAASTFAVLNTAGNTVWSISQAGVLGQGSGGGDIVFNATTTAVRTNSTNGSDTKEIYISSSDQNADPTRGAYLRLKGNEVAGGGDAVLESGDSVGSDILIRVNSAAGVLNLATNATIAQRITAAGRIQNVLAANEATGGGSALLGANCPAVTVAAPFTWVRFVTSDGSDVFIPVWK